MNTDYNVLSCFDGMSCGQIALNELGITPTNYFASEIDEHAIKITMKNYPNTIQLGDITKIDLNKLPKIDLLLGGSPCQGFSFAGKQLNFSDPRSRLFFDFHAIYEFLKARNPNIKFLLENVKMKKESMDVISKHMGVQPIEINSNLVSAQNRKRIYWTNIDGVTVPADQKIFLRDIVQESVHADISAISKAGKAHSLTATYNRAVVWNSYEKNQRTMLFEELDRYKVPFNETFTLLTKNVQEGKMGYFRKDSQANRVYYLNEKAITLCGSAGGGCAKMGQYFIGHISKSPENKPSLYNKFYTLVDESGQGWLVEGYIRKLAPIECERLQTVPEHYTAGVSDVQRYRMLGNGWTVAVIKHILKNLLGE